MNNSKTINGRKFYVNKFPASEALKIQNRLARLVSPSLGALASIFFNSGKSAKESGKTKEDIMKQDNVEAFMNADISGEDFQSAIRSIFAELDEDTFFSLVLRILKETSVEMTDESGNKKVINIDGKQSFDMVFEEDLMEVYQVIGFVLQVNYPSFFQKVRDIGKKMGATNTSGKVGGSKKTNSKS